MSLVKMTQLSPPPKTGCFPWRRSFLTVGRFSFCLICSLICSSLALVDSPCVSAPISRTIGSWRSGPADPPDPPDPPRLPDPPDPPDPPGPRDPRDPRDPPDFGLRINLELSWPLGLGLSEPRFLGLLAYRPLGLWASGPLGLLASWPLGPLGPARSGPVQAATCARLQ